MLMASEKIDGWQSEVGDGGKIYFVPVVGLLDAEFEGIQPPTPSGPVSKLWSDPIWNSGGS